MAAPAQTLTCAALAPVPLGPVLDNLHPSLARAWHPIALSRDLRSGGWLQVRLLGRTWSLHRDEDGLAAAPPAFDVGERYGWVWLAPAEPRGGPLEVPEASDRRFVVRHLAPVRAAGPAAPLLDTLLGQGEDAVVEDAAGFSAVREATDREPLRTTTAVRTPFGLSRRVEDPSSGASTTVVVVLQPEDADSTRAYGMVLRSAGPGQQLPSPATVAATVSVEQRMMTEAAAMPLATDRPGPALRRALGRFAAG